MEKEQLLAPDFSTLQAMGKINQIRLRIKELKDEKSLPEPFASMDFSHTENLISFISSEYGKTELSDLDYSLPNKKEVQKANIFFRRLSKGEPIPQKVIDQFISEYVAQKGQERDQVVATIQLMEEQLQAKEKLNKDYMKKFKKGKNIIFRSKLFNFVRKIIGAAFIVGAIALVFALPSISGLGALFLGSTNAFIGTIGCAIAAYYVAKDIKDMIKDRIKKNAEVSAKNADLLIKQGSGKEATKTAEECAELRARIAKLQAQKEQIKNEMSGYDSQFVDKFDEKRVEKIKETMLKSMKDSGSGNDGKGKSAGQEASGESKGKAPGEAVPKSKSEPEGVATPPTKSGQEGASAPKQTEGHDSAVGPQAATGQDSSATPKAASGEPGKAKPNGQGRVKEDELRAIEAREV